ncbi:hypothetical protein ABT369_39290 [Dactylosporangium sp. NPDC000244]|uniref:hypothetical protein n=1 Tax=Dactylosporangium sp. NPDC000244 TaxID=3154365 RepID=UPI003324CCAF
MASLFERVIETAHDNAEHGDTTAAANLGAALRAVLAPHEPEQHYVRGQDNRDRPSFLYCRTCRKQSPCTPLLLAAAELGLNPEEAK